MDFFVLPRPSHKISAHAIRSKELDNLIEYNNENGPLLTNGVGIVRMEGYNPAVLDIGCTFSGQVVVVWNQNLQSYFSGTGKTKKTVKAFDQTLINLKAEVPEYPVGVESKALVKKFRQKWEFDDSKPLFGKYSDAEGILSLPDVFYPQNLGKDKRVILFPSLYEGLIVTPEEILLRIWNRIKYLLEVSNQNSVKVTELQEKYEELFGQPLYPLNWGFSDVNEFIEYSLQIFSEELTDLNCVQKGEVDETQIVEETEDDNEVEEAMMDQGVDFWLALDEPLPSNYVFKLPYRMYSF